MSRIILRNWREKIAELRAASGASDAVGGRVQSGFVARRRRLLPASAAQHFLLQQRRIARRDARSQVREAEPGTRLAARSLSMDESELCEEGTVLCRLRRGPGSRRSSESRRSEGFFAKYVAGTEEIPWNDFFRAVGLRLAEGTTTAANAGFSASRNFDGPMKVEAVAAGCEAERAGLKSEIRFLKSRENLPVRILASHWLG